MTAERDGAYVFTSKAAGFSDEQLLLVWQWEGEDALSRGYRFRIDLALPIDNPMTYPPLLGERATFSNAAQGVRWHGIVTRMQQTGKDHQYRYFQVLLEPRFTLTRLDRTSRVHASAQSDIKLRNLVQFTFEKCGLQTRSLRGADDADDHGDYRWLVAAEYEDCFATDFVCQYEETSYDFLARHLEHAGVYYAFEHLPDTEQMVFCSDGSPSAETIALAWRPDTDQTLAAHGNTVHTLNLNTSLAPQHILLRDHYPENVALDLFARQEVHHGRTDPLHALHGRHVAYGERFTTKANGEHLAKLRAEQAQCTRNRHIATGCVPRLRAGTIVTIDDHPQLGERIPMRVIEAWQTGYQPLPGKAAEEGKTTRVDTRWTAIPKARPFRPERITPVPRIPGLVTAVVESAHDGYHPHRASAVTSDAQKDARDYPYVNKNGYYRIRFHFAENALHWQAKRDDAAPRDWNSAAPHVPRHSGWVRMATPYAGASGTDNGEFGMYFPLNEGAEVLVSFLNGDPDRPVIIGAVPNSHNPSLVDGDADRLLMGSDAKDKPQYTNRVAGLVTQGGNMLAFNTEPDKQTIALSSPVANSFMVMGGHKNDADAQGILLHTKKHIVMEAKSKREEIEGKGLRRIYDLIPTAPEKKEPPPSTKIVDKSTKFNLRFLTGEAGLSINKPKVSASLNLSAAASANLSLDLALKLGASFTGIVAADWSVGFSAKTDVNFLEHNRTKKAESIKTSKRTALVIEDELKAGKRTEKIIRKETYSGSTMVYSDSVYRNEAVTAVVLSVRRARSTTETPNVADLNSAVQPKGLFESLVPDLKHPFSKAAPIPSLSDIPQDSGGVDSDAFSTLLLTKDNAELIAPSDIKFSVPEKDGSKGEINLQASQNGRVVLKGGKSIVELDSKTFSADSAGDASLTAKGSLSLTANKEIYMQSASIKGQGKGKVELDGALLKLG